MDPAMVKDQLAELLVSLGRYQRWCALDFHGIDPG
jgi:hypothetical protein